MQTQYPASPRSGNFDLLGKMLAQTRPANTTAATAYTRATSAAVIVTGGFVCNTSGASAKFRIFFHNSGTTYDATTALYWDVTVPADDTYELNWKDNPVYLNTASGTIGVRTDTNNALTFTFFGQEIL